MVFKKIEKSEFDKWFITYNNESGPYNYGKVSAGNTTSVKRETLEVFDTEPEYLARLAELGREVEEII